MHVLIQALHRPTKPTGVCRHAANLSQSLSEDVSVTRVTVLIGKWQSAYFEKLFEFLSPKINLISIDIKNSSLSRNQWFIFGLPQLARQSEPDIIHLAFPLPFVRQWFEVPVISTIHDLYPLEYPDNFGYPQVWFNQIFLRQCVDNSDGLICVSSCTLESLKYFFPRVKTDKKTAVIYNIVDFSAIQSKQPRESNGIQKRPYLLTVAQHRKNKNLDILIQAYGSLLHTDSIDSATQLVLVGSEGPETESLKGIVQTLRLEDKVLFFSGLDDQELRWLYEHTALFVIPSSTEGFCLPLVEALVLSSPVVCSDIPIFREVGASHCHYFQLDNQAMKNLTKAILSELNNKSLRTRMIDSRFSKSELRQRLLSFYSLF